MIEAIRKVLRKYRKTTYFLCVVFFPVVILIALPAYLISEFVREIILGE